MTVESPPVSSPLSSRAIDPITVEVIGNALSSIVEEMGETLVRASYSTNIKERRDSSTCLFDARGRTLCQASHIPMHLGSLIGVVEEIGQRVRARGHPRRRRVHRQRRLHRRRHAPARHRARRADLLRRRLVGWATNTAHHADFVDRSHAHIFQEGLRIPPVRLYREGKLVQDVLDLVLLNCQVPRERLNDLRAQMAANRLGIQRFQRLCRALWRELLLEAAGDALLDYAERLTRAGIRTIPSGVYTFEDTFESNELDEILELQGPRSRSRATRSSSTSRRRRRCAPASTWSRRRCWPPSTTR